MNWVLKNFLQDGFYGIYSIQSKNTFELEPQPIVWNCLQFMTMDDTWNYHYTPETLMQSKQWIKQSESIPKKGQHHSLGWESDGIGFWDAKVILLIGYFEKGITVIGQYYITLLDKLKAAIQEKRPGIVKKKVLFHHANASDN